MGDAGHSRNPLAIVPLAIVLWPSSSGSSSLRLFRGWLRRGQGDRSEQVAQAVRLQQDAIERVGLLRRKVVHLH